MKLLASQPKPFYLIFFIEIWERFGFYGLQALIVLYMVQGLHYTDHRADLMVSGFVALAYLLPCAGGLIGDRVLGTKRSIILGAIILAIGYLVLSLPLSSPHVLVWALATIVVGNALFKPNPSSLLSKVYDGTNQNRDSGFTLYYMAINIGSVVSMTLTPILNRYYGWHAAFIACFGGLILALLSYVLLRKTVADVGSKPDFEPIRWNYLFYVVAGCSAAIVISFWLLTHHSIMTLIIALGIIFFVSFFIYEAYRAKPKERAGMVLFLLLFSQAIVFFTCYFQMPMSLNLFALRNVEHTLLGLHVEPAQFQALNSFWILVMSPVLASMYQKWSKNKKDPSMPTKFTVGTLLAGLGYMILPIGAYFSTQGIVSSWWLVLAYLFLSTGELLVSALGLSLAAKYIPQRFMGYGMGLWYLAISVGGVLAGKVSSFASIPHNISSDPALSLPVYTHVFLWLGLGTAGVSFIMLLFVPYLKRLGDRSITPG
jgi:POT family proton-dependent oligopeptide transporter